MQVLEPIPHNYISMSVYVSVCNFISLYIYLPICIYIHPSIFILRIWPRGLHWLASSSSTGQTICWALCWGPGSLQTPWTFWTVLETDLCCPLLRPLGPLLSIARTMRSLFPWWNRICCSCYILKEENRPVVMHFPLFNKDNCGGRCMGRSGMRSHHQAMLHGDEL